MLSQRIAYSALALTTVLGSGALVTTDALAKGRCAAGQILRVSSGTCMSKTAAVEQGIIGGKHRSHRQAARAEKSARAADASEAEDDSDSADSEQTTSIPRSEPPAPKPAPTRSAAAAISASASPVKIEVVKTEPRPTPAILTPTWPYGELAAFPRRVSP